MLSLIEFNFYSQVMGILDLIMEDLVQAFKVYAFFKEYLSIQPSMRKGAVSTLEVEWRLKAENKEASLQNIEQAMGFEWRKVFGTILSALQN